MFVKSCVASLPRRYSWYAKRLSVGRVLSAERWLVSSAKCSARTTRSAICP